MVNGSNGLHQDPFHMVAPPLPKWSIKLSACLRHLSVVVSPIDNMFLFKPYKPSPHLK